MGWQLYESFCEHVVVDDAVSSLKVSKNLESHGVSEPKRVVLD